MKQLKEASTYLQLSITDKYGQLSTSKGLSQHLRCYKHKIWMTQEREWLKQQKCQLEEDIVQLEQDKHLFD